MDLFYLGHEELGYPLGLSDGISGYLRGCGYINLVLRVEGNSLFSMLLHWSSNFPLNLYGGY